MCRQTPCVSGDAQIADSPAAEGDVHPTDPLPFVEARKQSTLWVVSVLLAEMLKAQCMFILAIEHVLLPREKTLAVMGQSGRAFPGA